MALCVVPGSSGHRLSGDACDVGTANRFLEHLSVRNFSPATRRAYAYDLLNFFRFCSGRALTVRTLEPMDVFDYLDWQQGGRVSSAGSTVVMLADRRRAGPATLNRRIAAVRGLFEYAVLAGERPDNPVPAARRSSGVRAVRRGLLGHLGHGRPRSGGRLVRTPRLLPESLDLAEVDAFIGDLLTARDRSMALLMLLRGCGPGRSAVCGWPTSTRGQDLSPLSGRAANSGWCRWTGNFSPSWPPICGPNGLPGAAPSSVSWCSTARPVAGR